MNGLPIMMGQGCGLLMVRQNFKTFSAQRTQSYTELHRDMSEIEYNAISSRIVKAAIEVHNELGPGLLESVYENCLMDELKSVGLFAKQQVQLPLFYKGKKLNKDFVIDILVEDKVILELKSIETILPIHDFQLLTYLKLSGMKLGLLINFNVVRLKDGIHRKINGTL